MRMLVYVLAGFAYVLVLLALKSRKTQVSGLVVYVLAGIVLAAFRIVVLWYIYLYPGEFFLQPMMSVILSPEGEILYVLNLRNQTSHMILFSVLLFFGSLVLVSPLLLIGSQKKIRVE